MTTRDQVDLARDMLLAHLAGAISDRTARTYVQTNRELRHTIMQGEQIGPHKEVMTPPEGETDSARQQELEALERQLQAELEAERDAIIASHKRQEELTAMMEALKNGQ